MSGISVMSSVLHLVSQFGLVWFYGISTIVGYAIPNPLYIYTKYI